MRFFSAPIKQSRLFLLVGTFILPIFLTGCTLPQLPFLPKPKPQNITLKYWGLWEPESIMQKAILDYQNTHPNVTIEYQKQSLVQYRERLQARITSADGPDIFRLHNTWLPMFKNYLSPLPQTVMDNAAYEKTFYPTTKYDLKIGQSYYGLPLEFDGLALYYNEDLLATAGTTNPPTTWDELRNTAIKATRKDDKTGQIKTAGVALGTTGNVDNWSDILGLMMLQNGVDLKNPTNDLAADALTYYTLFVTKDKVWDPNWESSIMAFSSGKVAMIFAPSWRFFEIQSLNPNLKFKLAPVPQLPGGEVNWASYWVEGVSAKSPNQAQAWDFLKYLSEAQTMQKTYAESAKIRLFGEPYSRRDLADSLKDDPYAGPFIKQAPNAASWYLASNTQDNGINDQIIKYFEDAVNSVVSGSDAASALQTVAKGVTVVLSQYGLVSAPKNQ